MTELRYNPGQAYLTNFIRDVRENMGITQAEFAQLAGLKTATLGGVESYYRIYSEPMIIKLASFLQVELTYLLMLRDLQELARLVSLTGLSDEVKERFYTLCAEAAGIDNEGEADA